MTQLEPPRESKAREHSAEDTPLLFPPLLSAGAVPCSPRLLGSQVANRAPTAAAAAAAGASSFQCAQRPARPRQALAPPGIGPTRQRRGASLASGRPALDSAPAAEAGAAL